MYLFDLGAEAVAAPGDGLYVARGGGVVAKRRSQLADGLVDRLLVVEGSAIRPENLSQFFARRNGSAFLDKEYEESNILFRDVNRVTTRRKPSQFHIEREWMERNNFARGHTSL